MNIVRRTLLTSGAALMLGILSSPLSVSLARAKDVEINRGIGQTIGTLDPHLNALIYENWVEDDMYEGLVANDAAGRVIPGAAEKWDISEDGKTFTFHLRDGLKWSNGDQLVAQDYVNGIIRTITPETGSEKAYIFTTTLPVVGATDFNKGANKDPKSVGVSAPDERTVVVQLTRPAPFAPMLFGAFYSVPLHTPSFEKYGKEFVRPGNIVNNGAYMMSESVPQSHVTLVKNPNFWDAANVKIDKVTYRVSESDATAVKLWKSGQLDITAEVPSEQVDTLRGEFGDLLHISPSLASLYLSFNISKAPFDNLKLRQALNLAIDRQVLIDKVVKGGYVPNYSYSIPMEGYDAPKIIGADLDKDARLAKAKELYAEAGFGPGKPLTLSIETSNNSTKQKIAEVAATMWKQTLGVDARVHAQDRDSWYATFSTGKWDVFNDNVVGDFASPESYLTYIDPRAGVGYFWQNKKYEQLLDTALSTVDQSERYKLLAQAEALWLNDVVVAPLAVSSRRALVNAKIAGWQDNASGLHPTRFLDVAAE